MALCNCKSAGSGNYDFCEAIHGECQFTADGYDDGHICSIKNFIDMKLYDRYGPPRPPADPPDPRTELLLEGLIDMLCTEDLECEIVLES